LDKTLRGVEVNGLEGGVVNVKDGKPYAAMPRTSNIAAGMKSDINI